MIQFEDTQSQRRFAARDFHMAQNTIWILDQLGPDTKLVVWAHNFHVADLEGAQGGFLSSALGSDYINLGFSFWQGTATAFALSGGSGVAPQRMPIPPPDSYEAHFRAAEAERFVLDMRGIPFDSPSTDWLAGPRPFRQIGCCINLANPASHTFSVSLPSWFDAVIFFETTGASELLPFTPPSSF